MSSRVVLLGCALLLAACSLDRVGVSGALSDAGGALDAGLPRDAGVRSEGGAADASSQVPDAGVDAGPSPELDAGQDAGVDAGQDAGPPRTCLEIYGEVGNMVELCEERDTECELFVDYGTDAPCQVICAEVGGTCLHAYNDSGGRCSRAAADDCTDERSSQICVCSRIQ